MRYHIVGFLVFLHDHDLKNTGQVRKRDPFEEEDQDGHSKYLINVANRHANYQSKLINSRAD